MRPFSMSKTFSMAAIFLHFFMTGCAKGGAGTYINTDTTPAGFRVVGYLSLGADPTGPGFPDLGKITHLNIAFLRPDSTGAFPSNTGVQTLVGLAHAKGVKVLLSIGGGNPPAYLKYLLDDNHQASFIQTLVALTIQTGSDGIDVDLEGEFIDNHYEGFVINLAALLKNKKKLITAAIATAYVNSYSDRALASFDFVNLMSYDHTGPWNPSVPGPHAPYQMAVDDLSYWTSRGIPKEKLVLGLPFYGYGFGTNAPESMSYGQIVRSYPASWRADQLTVPGGGIVYYNGAATIGLKTNLALQKTGGVMIWQLLQDAGGDRSLLTMIDSIAHRR